MGKVIYGPFGNRFFVLVIFKEVAITLKCDI